MKEIALNPGEYHITKKGGDVLVAVDVCGSVVVTMYDPSTTIGGAAHLILPTPPPGHEKEGSQFVTTGIPNLLDQITKEGAVKEQVAVKLVGGSCFLGSGIFSIGKRNVAKARETVSDLGLNIAGEDTGGAHKRNVKFHIKTGGLEIENIAK